MIQGYSLASVSIFGVLILFFLILDLFSHRQDRPISLKNAGLWSMVWVAVSLAFAAYLAQSQGSDKASLFLAGYFLEKSLSVDNLFVFMAIFASFSIKDRYQHRILYFGIVGALVLRFIFIGLGTSLLLLGQWVLIMFGLFVLWSAWQMYKQMGKEDGEIEDYTSHWSVRFVKKFLPVYPRLDGHKFFTHQNAKWCATPLLLCLVVIEVADIMFAFDSVPAVIAITNDQFLVYTSNIFAILGLRSMYFLLSAAKRYLCHLEKAVIGILVFIGLKMLLHVSEVFHISPNASLAVVGVLLTTGIVASIFFPVAEGGSNV